VRANRKYGITPEEAADMTRGYQKYDILIGPTADDKMFTMLQMYLDNLISAEQAVRYINAAGYSEQITLKTEKAVHQCIFQSFKEITGHQKQMTQDIARRDRAKMLSDLQKMREADIKASTKQPATNAIRNNKSDDSKEQEDEDYGR
jgi:hypothetical protein